MPIEEKFVSTFGNTLGYAGVTGGIESGGENPYRKDHDGVNRSIDDDVSMDVSVVEDDMLQETEKSKNRLGGEETSPKSATTVPCPIPMSARERVTKKEKLLDSVMQQKNLQKEVLNMQLEAARLTIETNRQIQSLLEKVDSLMDMMQAYFSREAPAQLVLLQATQETENRAEINASH